MKKKFECKNCRKFFEADDQDFVICPHCHSDNVEPASFHLPSWTGRILLIVALVGVVAGILWLFGQTGNGATESDKDDIIIPNDSSIIGDSLDYEYDADIPPTAEISEPIFDGKNYTVIVKAKNVPANMRIYYVRMNHFGDKRVLQKSDNGKFSDIPYNEESGNSYDFAIMDARTDTLICDPAPMTGFIRQIIVDESKKMTIDQLQKLIDGGDDSLLGTGENDYLAPDYKIEFQGINSEEEKPSSFSQIKERIILGIWKDVKVVNIGYDDKNRIHSILLKVITN